MRERLYYRDPHCRSFRATVTSCEPKDDKWLITLSETAFYPEGGGQPCDLGTIDGEPVTDVREKNGKVLHLCAAPVPVGTEAACEIDWERRFDLMQQHSGEHIVSGLVHAKYGYENVGFHMGRDMITIDFNGMIDSAGLREIEIAANQVIWRNLPVEQLFPAPAELAELSFRSKKALSGEVRLVRFPGVDLCACCGTHVSCTGEIGIIQLLNCVKFHEGVRIELLCGGRALKYLQSMRDQNHSVSVRLSAKPLETGIAVERMANELQNLKERSSAAETELMAFKAERYRGAGKVTAFENDMDPGTLRRYADAVLNACGGSCALFSGSDEEGYSYVLASTDTDLRAVSKMMNAALRGRGGGKAECVQGRVGATGDQIRQWLQENL
ncbi:MAG: DHHA1 domain-containing protein [Clostridia bacterium]|nr:DHHA1 domain-containing protein [Clostridia bacterium]